MADIAAADIAIRKRTGSCANNVWREAAELENPPQPIKGQGQTQEKEDDLDVKRRP